MANARKKGDSGPFFGPENSYRIELVKKNEAGTLYQIYQDSELFVINIKELFWGKTPLKMGRDTF